MQQQTKKNDAAICVIIPANNEEALIGMCLTALLGQDSTVETVEIIVAANACTDKTVEISNNHTEAFRARGWHLRVLHTDTPGKLNALNLAEKSVTARARIYLDADVIVDKDIIGQIADALARDAPTYATGTFTMQPARTWVSRHYGAFWMELPFMKSPAVGAGLFAVNEAGRARWAAFPDIISDDTFVRLQFSPDERRQVSARYHWPLVEGFGKLVKVRRRQDAGVKQLRQLHPQIFENEDKKKKSILHSAIQRPIGFVIYALVQLAVKVAGPDKKWTRGR